MLKPRRNQNPQIVRLHLRRHLHRQPLPRIPRTLNNLHQITHTCPIILHFISQQCHPERSNSRICELRSRRTCGCTCRCFCFCLSFCLSSRRDLLLSLPLLLFVLRVILSEAKNPRISPLLLLVLAPSACVATGICLV